MSAPASRPRRRRGLSVRWRLTLSYAGFLVVAGSLLLAVVGLFLLRYVPRGPIPMRSGFVPDRGDLQDAFLPAAAWAMAFLLVVGLAGGWLLAGRMLAPLDRITEATRRAGAGSLSHRIALPGRQDEFRELADSFDAMLARIQSQVEEQRRFAANASHELRTPLAASRALIEVARSDPEADLRQVLERLAAVTTRAVDLTEALLLLSRAEGGVFAQTAVDLSLCAEEAAETLLPMAEARGVELRILGGVAPAQGSEALLGQLVANLVHNGIVHNLPAGGWVEVRTAAQGSDALLRVANSGAPVDPDTADQLLEPFHRGSGRTRSPDGAGGVGLGLAIVRAIVDAHHGQLALHPRGEGGLEVEIRLPGAR
ncbi:sensor histidine kinase [Brachybacterium phenoliresistens]|nr:HAMP domain-containing sensor histidine kinase [Brachybacterium phenoliresistens]